MIMKRNLYFIFLEINKVLGAASLIFLVVEMIKPRLILAYINLNWWFIFWLASAIITLVLNNLISPSGEKK